MIDINELRQKITTRGLDVVADTDVLELLDRLEAAEAEALEQARLNGMGSKREAALMAKLEVAEKTNREWLRANAPGGCIDNMRIENETMRAKVEAMEQQEPVAKVHIHQTGGNAGVAWSAQPLNDFDSLPPLQDGDKLYALPGAQAQPAPSVPNLDMDALERQNDDLKAEVGRLRDALALIADQYEPKCSLLIPSIARTALNATGAYGQKESPESWPTEAMVTAFAELFNVRDQKNTFGPAFRAALAAAPEAKP